MRWLDSWADDRACAGVDPEVFHRKDSESDEAKRICGRCPVRVECYEAALQIKAVEGRCYGVWGGVFFGERKKLAS